MPFGSMWRRQLGLSLSMTALVVAIALGGGGSWSAVTGGRVGPPGVSAQDANPLPRDRDQQMVTGRCIICHSLEMIAASRAEPGCLEYSSRPRMYASITSL